jgi:hypothetical protein
MLDEGDEDDALRERTSGRKHESLTRSSELEDGAGSELGALERQT